MSNSLCTLPWTHLATHPHGGITLCCQSEMAKGLSAAANGDGRDPMTLNDRSIDDLVNSRTFREVRLSMLNGERHPACGPCWSREDHGVVSKRQYENERFPLSLQKAQELTSQDGSIKPDIQFAELRLGNVCNIKCVTCNPNSSVQHVNEHASLRKQEGMEFLRDYSWVNPGMANWTEDQRFWDDLETNAPRLKEVYINGGEPMLIRKHAGFLEKLVSNGQASQTRLMYSLNLTKLIEPLRNLWPHFAEVHFACSVDDWDQRNFYIRYPSVWKTVAENFGKLQQWKVKPSVLQTVSALNFFYLDDFYKRWQSLYPETAVSYNEVVDPPWFSPLVFPPALRRDILARLACTLPGHLHSKLVQLYDNEEHLFDQWPFLKRHLQGFDSYRDMDVREYFPELESFLNKHGESLR